MASAPARCWLSRLMNLRQFLVCARGSLWTSRSSTSMGHVWDMHRQVTHDRAETKEVERASKSHKEDTRIQTVKAGHRSEGQARYSTSQCTHTAPLHQEPWQS